MARHKMNLGDLATGLLSAVERQGLGKTAGASYISKVSSEMGVRMVKVAEDLRNHKPAPVNYRDLAEFRKRYAV